MHVVHRVKSLKKKLFVWKQSNCITVFIFKGSVAHLHLFIFVVVSEKNRKKFYFFSLIYTSLTNTHTHTHPSPDVIPDFCISTQINPGYYPRSCLLNVRKIIKTTIKKKRRKTNKDV